MFRALAATQQEQPRREGFMDQNQYVSQTTPMFESRLAKMVLTGLPTAGTTTPKQILQNVSSGLGTWDPSTRQTSTRDIDLAEYATSIDVATSLNTQNNTCKVASLDSLMNTQNANDRVRCGWIYKRGGTNGVPAVSQGALGTMTGPVATFPAPQGTWYWSLDDAKKAMEVDKCAALTNCSQVGSPQFKGCAFSKTRGIGIPVDEQGNVKYFRDPKASAPPSSLVRSPGGCPPPPAVGSAAYEYQRTRDVCTPLPNGQLSRDCMLQQITVGGCKPDGSLYIALQTGASPNNYAATLQPMTAFKKYQEAAKKPLLDNVIRDGRTTTEIALGNFKDLAQQTIRREETALSYAARDLCLKKGTMDQFDFCTELKDATRGPFLLECLQKEFRRQGGQPAGTLYPSNNPNGIDWNGLGTWGQVKARIASMAALTKSSNEAIQRTAMTQFYGIVRQPYGFKQIGIIQGMEVMWVNDSTATVLGRKLTIGAKASFPRFSTGGVVEESGLPDRVSYIAINNVRPPQDMSVRLRLETSDGIIYTLNKDIDPVGTRGKSIHTTDTLGANWDQTTTRYDAKTCWSLKGQGPNYILGFWQDTAGQAHSAVMYAPCNGTQFKDIPATWLTLTQEPDAPMFSWEGIQSRDSAKQFIERRLPVAMVMNASPQTSIVANTGAAAIPKIGALLKLKNSGSGYAITSKNFAMNSWRTLTTQFFINSMADGAILRFGPIEFGIQNRMAICSFQSGSLKVRKAWQVQASTTPYYFYINMRSEYNGKYPNRLTMAFGQAADFKAGRINVQQEGPTVVSFTTTQNAPLYAQSDAAKVELGDKTARKTADVSVGYLRLFDYEMNSTDVQRDIQNAWLMDFFRN